MIRRSQALHALKGITSNITCLTINKHISYDYLLFHYVQI